MLSREHFTGGKKQDRPVPVGPHQNVPTEKMARLLADLVGKCDKVLEIGTGSGYQASILAERCREVVSIEVQPREGIAAKLPANVTLRTGDGCTSDTGEQFDAVLVTFAAPEIYPVWGKQLKEGGRLIVPRGTSNCAISVYVKHGNELTPVAIAAYAPFTKMVRK